MKARRGCTGRANQTRFDDGIMPVFCPTYQTNEWVDFEVRCWTESRCYTIAPGLPAEGPTGDGARSVIYVGRRNSGPYDAPIPSPKFNRLVRSAVLLPAHHFFGRIIGYPSIAQNTRKPPERNNADITDEVSEIAFDCGDLVETRQISKDAPMRVGGTSVEAQRPIAVRAGHKKFQLTIGADVFAD